MNFELFFTVFFASFLGVFSAIMAAYGLLKKDFATSPIPEITTPKNKQERVPPFYAEGGLGTPDPLPQTPQNTILPQVPEYAGPGEGLDSPIRKSSTRKSPFGARKKLSFDMDVVDEDQEYRSPWYEE